MTTQNIGTSAPISAHFETPRPDPDGTGLSMRFDRPFLETFVARKFTEILSIDSVKPDDEFFALGGCSLQALRLATDLSEALSIDLSVGDLVEHNSPRAIATAIVALGGSRQPQPHLEPRGAKETVYITRGQRLFWRFGVQKDLASYFNLRQAVMLHGPLDVDALRDSLQALVDRHDSLRMRFRPVNDSRSDNVELIVPERQPMTFALIESAAMDGIDPQAVVRSLLQEEIEQPFDLYGEPLVRFTLVRFTVNVHALLVTMHHLITDAWSLNVFRRELNLLYRARIQGHTATLPDLPIQFADYAHWNARLHVTPRYREQLSHWDNLFDSLGPIEGIPGTPATDRARGTGTRFTDLSITDPDVNRLSLRSARHNTTPYVLLHAVMHLTLYKAFRHFDRMLVLSPSTDRHRPELEHSIGMYLNIVGITSAISPGMTLREFIAQMKRSVHEALEHSEARQFALYDFSKRKASDFPLVLYNYLPMPNDCDWALGDLRVEFVMPPDDERAFITCLELHHARAGGALWGALGYAASHFEEAEIGVLVADYRAVLETIVSGDADNSSVSSLVGRQG